MERLWFLAISLSYWGISGHNGTQITSVFTFPASSELKMVLSSTISSVSALTIAAKAIAIPSAECVSRNHDLGQITKFDKS